MRLKNKLSKILSLVLACLIISSTLSMAACGGSSSGNAGGADTPTAQNPVSDAGDRGPLTNTLHKVNVTSSNRTLVTQAGTVFANTEYKIIADTSNSYTLRAATFISPSRHVSEVSLTGSTNLLNIVPTD